VLGLLQVVVNTVTPSLLDTKLGLCCCSGSGKTMAFDTTMLESNVLTALP